MKTVVIIGGGLFQCYAIRKANTLGLRTVCCDMDPHAPGAEISDYFIRRSTKDHKSIIAELGKRDFDVHAVMTVGTDMSRSVYNISRSYGIDPGFSDPETVVNKIEMRKALKKHGVPCPGFVYSDNVDDIIKKRKENDLNFPLVLKPSENMGARGVIRVDSDKDIKDNWQNTYAYSPDRRVLLEEYMQGSEISVESIVYNGKCHCLVYGDRHIEHAPYFVEIGHSCPSVQSRQVLDDIEELMAKAAHALGIYNAPAKGDIMITEKGVMVGEIAARLSGGFMSSHTLPLSTGIDAIRLALLQRTGEVIEACEFSPKYSKACIERAIIPKQTGIIKKITGVEEAKNLSGVCLVHLNKDIHDRIERLTSNIGKVGNVIITGSDVEETERIWKKVQDVIKVEI